jgi:hypothetical protein
MTHHRPSWRRPRPALVAILLAGMLPLSAMLPTGAAAQEPPKQEPPKQGTNAPAPGTFLLTIFLKHDQSKNLEQINAQLRAQGFYKAFPPPGIEVVSWYVMMGIGQVITLRVPAERLREVNRSIEQTAWGGYHTEFYPTYDFKQVGEQEHARAQSP